MSERVTNFPMRLMRCALCAGAIFGIHPASAAQLTYESFIERARMIQQGETRAQIIAVLGAPAGESAAFLDYSLAALPGFPGLPGPVGTQVFAGMRVELHNGHMAGAIKWDWMDTTGPAPAVPKTH